MAATGVACTRYYLSTLLLLLFYLPLIIIPWVVQCMLDVKPMIRAGSSYVANRGDYAPKDIAAVSSWMRAAALLNLTAAALAVPAVSTVLTHAAVVMIHRRDPARPLNLRSLLSLSDNPWTRKPDTRGSRFVLAGLALVALSVVVPLLQVALVVPKAIRVASCQDTPKSTNPSDICDGYSRPRGYTAVGRDAEPAVLDIMPANIMSQRVGQRLQTINERDSLPYIWDEDLESSYVGYTTEDPTLYAFSGDYPKPRYFVSALPHDTNTGVLRAHALRMNSSTTCEDIPSAEFPETCPGDRPFAGEFSTELTTIRFCAPGAYGTAPWTLNRNRQDITEEVYFDIFVPENSTIRTEDRHISVRCEVNSTRGYFELPNYYNDGFPGPLLEKWPSYLDLKENFNDYIGLYNAIPAEIDPLLSLGLSPDFPPIPYGPDYNRFAAGPLMTFLVSALGHYSFFATAVNASTPEEHDAAFVSICETGLPLDYLSGSHIGTRQNCYKALTDYALPYDPTLALSNVVYTWFINVASTTDNQFIGAGTYLAQEQYLTIAADSGADSGKTIYTAPGTMITKPDVSPGLKVFVSVLLGIQVVALLGLAGYIYSTKTFGTRIDAVAVMVLGIRSRSRLGGAASVPRLGRVTEKDLVKLEKVDGMAVFHEAANGSAVPGTGADGDMELVERDGFRMSDEAMLPTYETVVRGSRN